jgi:deazaflavin-dependent oxidoreductase (nitroreductase family)
MLLLTTTGRASGLRRSVPLIYLEWSDALVVVGSNWGRAHDPAWTDNLLANPRAVVHLGARSQDVDARLATREELAEVWPLLVKLCPVWQTYGTWSGRALRVFVLRSVGPPSSGRQPAARSARQSG